MDEEMLKKRISSNQILNYLPQFKNKLHSLLLKSLDAFHTESTPKNKIRNQIRQAEYLEDKGLLQQAFDLLTRAGKKADEEEEHLLHLEILQLQNRLAVEMHNFEASPFPNLEDEDAPTFHRVKDAHESSLAFEALAKNMTMCYFRKGVRSQDARDCFEAIDRKADEIFANSAQPVNTALFYYHLKSALHYYLANFNEALKWCKTCVDTFKAHPAYIDKDRSRYINSLGTYGLVSRHTGNYDQFLQTIDTLRQLPEKYADLDRRDRLKICMETDEREIYYRIWTREFDRCEELIQHIQQWLTEFGDILGNSRIYHFYFNFLNVYMMAGKYDNAFYWYQTIKNKKGIKLNKDIQTYIRIFELMLHYEFGNEELLDNILLSTYKYLYRKNMLNAREQTFLKYLRRFYRIMPDEKGKMRQTFREARNELANMMEDEEAPKLTIGEFNFLPWLDEKIALLNNKEQPTKAFPSVK
ncbi:MAG: hypothetical protein BRD50_02775 [Bacteroidetes bacterium SW_11_45_7]|nr:MAG: hypothetical protein BRD50_02775 [Bacteroidetes bacterium SW_11_45_7]